MLSIVIALLIGLAIGQYVTIKIDPALTQGIASIWESIVGKVPDIRDALTVQLSVSGNAFGDIKDNVAKSVKSALKREDLPL